MVISPLASIYSTIGGHRPRAGSRRRDASCPTLTVAAEGTSCCYYGSKRPFGRSLPAAFESRIDSLRPTGCRRSETGRSSCWQRRPRWLAQNYPRSWTAFFAESCCSDFRSRYLTRSYSFSACPFAPSRRWSKGFSSSVILEQYEQHLAGLSGGSEASSSADSTTDSSFCWSRSRFCQTCPKRMLQDHWFWTYCRGDSSNPAWSPKCSECFGTNSNWFRPTGWLVCSAYWMKYSTFTFSITSCDSFLAKVIVGFAAFRDPDPNEDLISISIRVIVDLGRFADFARSVALSFRCSGFASGYARISYALSWNSPSNSEACSVWILLDCRTICAFCACFGILGPWLWSPGDDLCLPGNSNFSTRYLSCIPNPPPLSRAKKYRLQSCSCCLLWPSVR